MQEGIERFGHSIHSFCFMTNHIHLAIQVNEASISRIMQNLAFRYTRYINKKYKRVGHLFQGRFKSIIVDGQRYLKELVRYIHLNPIRANLVNQPEEYRWSSHRAYLTLDEYTWLTCDTVLQKFSNTRNEAMFRYVNFISEGIGVESDLDFKVGESDGILGDEEFVVQFLGNVKEFKNRDIELLELVKKLCERYDISEEALRAPGKSRLESHVRGILAFFVKEAANLSIEELAAFLNRDSSGLSKLASRVERKCAEMSSIEAEVSDVRRWIQTGDFQILL